MGQWSSIYLLFLPSPSFFDILQGHPAEPPREASQAAPLCAWADGSQRYEEVQYLTPSGYEIFSEKSFMTDSSPSNNENCQILSSPLMGEDEVGVDLV